MSNNSVQDTKVPLYVDLDGTLVKQDTLHESILAVLKRQPWMLFSMILWLLHGKAYFKQQLAPWVSQTDIIPITDADWIYWLRQQKQQGRPLYLATASEPTMANRMAKHFGFFDGVIATADTTTQLNNVNLAGNNKRLAIQQHMEQQGFNQFDYAGNSSVDLPVWEHARQVVAVNASSKLVSQVKKICPEVQSFGQYSSRFPFLIKAMRPSQWSKNILLFVPLIAAHQWDLATWASVSLAFLAFCLLASSTYLVNDLLDLSNDRRHASKRYRPLASGDLPVTHALFACITLMLLGLGLALWLSPGFFLILILYACISLAYSFKLKTMPIIDVLILSGLYSLRIFAGATVAAITLSNWLLSVSMFMFLSLALAKRCAELEGVVLNAETSIARGRGYHQDDLPVLRAMGVACSFATVLVLALYIENKTHSNLYPSAEWLWGCIPIVLYWLMRLWIKATRRQLKNEDPLQFALHDRASWFAFVPLAGLVILASLGV